MRKHRVGCGPLADVSSWLCVALSDKRGMGEALGLGGGGQLNRTAPHKAETRATAVYSKLTIVCRGCHASKQGTCSQLVASCSGVGQLVHGLPRHAGQVLEHQGPQRLDCMGAGHFNDQGGINRLSGAGGYMATACVLGQRVPFIKAAT